MSKAPAMPMYWDAYLADTTHLSTEEHGAYLLLLAAMWRRNGCVPDDDKDNARILGLTPAKWRRIKARFADTISGFEIADGTITQEKLQKIWKNTQENIGKNRANGAKGGRPKGKENNDLDKANGSVSDNPNETIPEPYPYPKGGGGEGARAPAREATTDQPPASQSNSPATDTWREKLCEAMGLDPTGISPGGRIPGTQADMFEASKWETDLGLSKMEILRQIREVAAKKADGPAKSFKYFTPAMQRLAADKAAPKLEPATTGGHNGQQYHGISQQWGPAPYGPGNRPSAAVEQITRLAGLREAPGDGGG